MEDTTSLQDLPEVSDKHPPTLPESFQLLSTASYKSARPENSSQNATKQNNKKLTEILNSSGVTALMKMFIHPVSNIMLSQITYPPDQSTRVRSENHDSSFSFSPWSWMEPVRLYGIRYVVSEQLAKPPVPAVDININANDMIYRRVRVGRTMRNEIKTPSLSALALTIKSFLSTDFTTSQISTQRALRPVPGNKDLQAMAMILPMLSQDPLQYYDEAPMLRLQLLMHTLVDAEYCRKYSSLVQQTIINHVPGADPVVAWSALPADEVAGCRRPLVADNTVNMFAVTLDDYIGMYTGKFKNRNSAWLNTNFQKAVVVPIKIEWSHCNWLIPYILSFTTTAWWNFSRTVTWDNIRPRNSNTQTLNTEVRGLVEACTVVVEGPYDHIVLVIVDANDVNYSSFYIRSPGIAVYAVPVWRGQEAGVNYDAFSSVAYTWLGRQLADQGDFEHDTCTAWRQMCAMISLPGMADRIKTMVSEVCYTRRTAGMLATGLNPEAYKRRHNGFLALGDKQIAVDGTNFLRWDVDRKSNALARTQIRAEQTLRHSCCGIYPNSATYIGSGTNHQETIPCFQQERYSVYQYQINVAHPLCRIANFVGLIDNECSQSVVSDLTSNSIYTQSQSSLMLAMAGWAFGATGLPPNIASGYVNISNMAPDWVNHLVTVLTNNYIIEPTGRGIAGIATVTASDQDWNLASLVPLMQGLADNTTYDLNNINVPFWYVAAVMEKFNLTMSDITKRTPRKFGGALAGQGRKMVYSLDSNKPWYVQHLVMSDLGYEVNHWDFAAVTRIDEALARVGISWYPDLFIDATRENIAKGIYNIEYALPNPGVLQIVMTRGDYISQYLDCSNESWMRVIIWGNTPVEACMPDSWPKVFGDLQDLNAFSDWLWEGGQKAGSHVLMDSYNTTVTEAFQHLAKPIEEWAGENIRSWVESANI